MGRQRVLVVDDDPLIRDVLQTILDLEEFAVAVAADGEDAWERLQSAPGGFDVVVIDVMMPGLDGFELTRRIRESGPPLSEAAIVLLTARTGPEARAAGEQAGCDAFLTKPFSPLNLIDQIVSLEGGTAPGSGPPSAPAPTAEAS